MYDSNGLLSILDRFRHPSQARWIPILDTTTLTRRRGKDESYWPVGVSGTHFMCIILKVLIIITVCSVLLLILAPFRAGKLILVFQGH